MNVIVSLLWFKIWFQKKQTETIFSVLILKEANRSLHFEIYNNNSEF